MINPYLRAFVIGSSVLVFLPYFLAVKSMVTKNFRYDNYTIYAPIGLGLFNVLSLVLANKLKLSRKNRFLLISVLAPTFVAFFIYFRKVYNYSTVNQWFAHIWFLYLFYFIVFNFVVYYLDKHI
jgi:hypothetical protein